MPCVRSPRLARLYGPVGALTLVLAGACADTRANDSLGESGTASGDETGLEPIAEADMPAAIAEAYCNQVLACACDNAEFPDLESCIAARTASYEMAQSVAQAASLTYDGQCAARQIADIEAQGCSLEPIRLDAQTCQLSCLIYHGDDPIDAYCDPEPTTQLVVASSCQQGLYCEYYAGGQPYQLCADPCLGKAALGPDEPCGWEVGLCPEGYWCPNSQVCTPLAGLGEPCEDQEDHCAPGFVCDLGVDPSVCIESIPEGGACITDAWNHCDPHANLRCENDTCVPEQAWLCRSPYP